MFMILWVGSWDCTQLGLYSGGTVSASCVSLGFTHPFMLTSFPHMYGYWLVVNKGDGNNWAMCHSSPAVLAWLIHVVNDDYQEHQERARSNEQALFESQFAHICCCLIGQSK